MKHITKKITETQIMGFGCRLNSAINLTKIAKEMYHKKKFTNIEKNLLQKGGCLIATENEILEELKKDSSNKAKKIIMNSKTDKYSDQKYIWYLDYNIYNEEINLVQMRIVGHKIK